MTRIRTLAVALATVGMMAAAPVDPATASAVSERPAAWMVIQVWKHHRTELRVIDAEGRKVGQPASNVGGGDQTNPDWSPDGQTLTFGMVGDDGRDDLWTVRGDGSSPHRLYDCTGECSYIDDPAWSPDGASIAVCIMRSFDGADIGRLALVDVATGELTDLAPFDDTQFCAGPRWSADGTQIVLELVQRTGRSLNDDVTGVSLSLVDVASGQLVETLTDPAVFAATADWNRATGEIVYSTLADPAATAPDLFTVRPGGATPARLTWLADAGGAAFEPSVSGDGTSLIFVAAGTFSGLARLDLASGSVSLAFAKPLSASHPRHRPM